MYEGIPGAGKSTLKQAVSKYRGHTHLSLDRFTPSMWVYSKFRNETAYEFNEDVEKILEDNFDVYVIWCVCAANIAYSRCVIKNDLEDAHLERLCSLSNLYKEYFATVTTYSKIIEVNTEKDISICTAEIINFVDSC